MEEVRGAPSENMGIDAREAGAGTDAEIDTGAGAPEPAAREEGRECEKYHEMADAAGAGFECRGHLTPGKRREREREREREEEEEEKRKRRGPGLESARYACETRDGKKERQNTTKAYRRTHRMARVERRLEPWPALPEPPTGSLTGSPCPRQLLPR